MSKKLVKITLEYEDGEVHSLEGDEAQAWRDEVNNYIAMNALRNGSGGMSQRDWKVREKDGEEK